MRSKTLKMMKRYRYPVTIEQGGNSSAARPQSELKEIIYCEQNEYTDSLRKSSEGRQYGFARGGIVSVRDYKVNPCLGCNACFKNKDNTCAQKDDMPLIYEKMAHANMLVIASPVYFYGLSAQLKAVIDRCQWEPPHFLNYSTASSLNTSSA